MVLIAVWIVGEFSKPWVLARILIYGKNTKSY